MKIIISHDVDHITAAEHIKDLFLPKYVTRSLIELLQKVISFREFTARLRNIASNKLNNVHELIKFDIANNIRPFFFIAINNGRSLSYNDKLASELINDLVSKGIDVGVHGIDFSSLERIKAEFYKFEKFSNLEDFGIRIHYLKTIENTLEYLENAGYKFDSSVHSFVNPYKVGNMWEFPIHLMDSYMFYRDSNYQKKAYDYIKEESIQTICKAESIGIEYFTIITHDFYFNEAHSDWLNWYKWLIDYLKNSGYNFVTFFEAMKKLNYI